MTIRRLLAIVALGLLLPALAIGQGRPDPAVLMAAQRAALRPLAYVDGVWRGQATMVAPDGSRHTVTQTERVGPMLDSTLRVIEGRAYEADGKVAFNAFAVISWDAARSALRFRSHAMGMSGDYTFTPTDSGFVWEIPAGPMIIRYTATVRDGKWREVGDRIAPGQEPVRFFEMNLVRVGNTDWPAGGAVPQR